MAFAADAQPQELAAVAAVPARRADTTGEATDSAVASRVREDFLHAWAGYEKYAWGHDDLNPLSRTPHDWYGVSLLMTPIDAYDTMVIMGLSEEAARDKALILSQLSFDRDVSVQVFEVTIRLLGGLLSAYQLDHDPKFLRLAEDLGTRLLPAFRSPTGMPFRYVNLRTGAVRDSASNPAEVGTLMLEFGVLSKLTGQPRYYDAAKRAVVELYRRRSPIGLVGSTIDVRTGEWLDKDSYVGGGIDSYYEYLLKAWRLFGDQDFLAMWTTSIAAANRYLADERASGELWYGHANMLDGQRTATRFGALEAFLPATLALSGDTARASRLMASVERMWTQFVIEPEELDYATMAITLPGYQLRPEALESAYYMYSLTGREHYRDAGRAILEAIERWTVTDAGYASLSDVRTKAKQDRMHSFLFAETLKYAYLLFTARAPIDLHTAVFNTEAHPLRRTWGTDRK